MSDSDRDRDDAECAQLEDELERTRQLILERRNRFMAAALAGLGMATGACTRASVCLDVPVDTSGSGGSSGSGGRGGTGGSAGTRPSVCLSGRGAIDPVGGSGGGGSEMDDGGIDDGGEPT